MVGYGDTAAKIKVLDMVSVRPERGNEIGEHRKGIFKRLQFGDLTADMHVNTHNAKPGKLGSTRVSPAGTAKRNPEFTFRFSGRDLGMGPRIYVGIDPQRNVNYTPLRARNCRDQIQFCLRLDID